MDHFGWGLEVVGWGDKMDFLGLRNWCHDDGLLGVMVGREVDRGSAYGAVDWWRRGFRQKWWWWESGGTTAVDTSGGVVVVVSELW